MEKTNKNVPKQQRLAETYQGRRNRKTYQANPDGEVIDLSNPPIGGSPVSQPEPPIRPEAGAQGESGE